MRDVKVENSKSRVKQVEGFGHRRERERVEADESEQEMAKVRGRKGRTPLLMAADEPDEANGFTNLL